ncbi:MAG TPA: hypothetical protein VL728_10645 [Cyclobacteriaceae bacterium]|jgi:hypothetical protein|nr:hypothetical protein [Cyclobacteriaceae bacterium]
MNRPLIILMLAAVASHGQQKEEWLTQIEKSAKQGYRGVVSASMHRDEHGKKYIQLNFKDSAPNNFEPPFDELIDRINSVVYFSLPQEQLSTLDYVKLIFEGASGIYLRNQTTYRELVARDSSKQSLKCSLLPRYVRSNGLTLRLQEITKEEFYFGYPDHSVLRRKTKAHKHNDSLERVFRLKFGDKFTYRNGCYSFKDLTNQPQQFCRKEGSADRRDYEGYELLEEWNGFYIFYVYQYESGQYWILDSQSGRAIAATGRPRFISRNVIYSDGPEGEGSDYFISLFRLSDQKSFSMSIPFIFRVEESYYDETGVHMRVFNPGCIMGPRYLYIGWE